MELYYPITLEVLLVNEKLLGRDAFRCWTLNYAALHKFHSPVPLGMDRERDTMRMGAYLHWTLPRALRTGKQEDADGGAGPQYPLLPNRFLITRRCREEPELSRQWVLECDCPTSGQLSTEELNHALLMTTSFPVPRNLYQAWRQSKDPYRNQASVMYGTKTRPVMTANLGISFPLETWTERAKDMPVFLRADSSGHPAFTGSYMLGKGIFGFYDDLDGVDVQTIDYHVAGWYSIESQSDPLYFSGMAREAPWNRYGGVIEQDELSRLADSQQLNLAIGNSQEDAFYALAAQRFGEEGSHVADHLMALLYDEPELADQPDGAYRVSEKMKQRFYSPLPGGVRWEIEPSNGGMQEVPAEHLKWLCELNQLQTRMETEQKRYLDLVRELYDTWWKKGRLSSMDEPPATPSVEELEAYLDPKNESGIYWKCEAQKRALEKAAALLPKDPNAYGKERGLGSEYRLKALGKARYWKRNTPVVLLAGVDQAPDLDAGLDQRFPKQDVASLPPVQMEIPLCNEKALPKAVARLYRDFIEKCGKPAEGRFCQPWTPVFMEWRIAFVQVPWKEGWEFDGQEYRLKNNCLPDNVPLRSFSGICMLTPGIQRIFSAKILENQESGKAASQAASWPFLSQELTGLDMMMSQRDERMFRMPTDEQLLNLMEPATSAPLMNDEPLTDFMGIWGGQMYFTDLILYDKFGRILNVIRSEKGSGLHLSEHFPVLRSASMTPAAGIKGVKAPILLAPRLPVHARLNLEMPSLTRDGTTPVIAMAALSPLDGSLNLFSPSGASFGRLALGYDLVKQQRSVQWAAPANGCYGSVEEIKMRHPAAGAWIQALTEESQETYTALVQLIRRAFHGKRRSGGSGPAGRLLALTACSLSLELERAPYRNIDWPETLRAAPVDWMSYEFPIRLGIPENDADGMVGFYLNHDFMRLHSGSGDNPKDNWINLMPGVDHACQVQVLMDIQMGIHAKCGFLPEKKLEIPSSCYHAALDRIEYEISAGPVLFQRVEQEGTQAVYLPHPEKGGASWSWWEKKTEYPVTTVTSAYGSEASLREGTLAVRYGKDKE